jgi:1,2-diacylglycerol 3-alpha-glucosyltransferase
MPVFPSVTRVGLVSHWFNRGQAVVMRRVRDLLDDLGHETFVLARPTKEGFHRPAYVERSDAWAQPGVTEASAFAIPWQDYERWLDATGVETVLCFQNYGFAELRRVRERGVRTIGCFMWEAFGPEHVAGALDAYDVVYALTRCGRRRYAELGIDGPYIPWGCHPDDLALRRPADAATDPVVTFYAPAGYVSRRKPLPEVIDAFKDVDDARLRLVIKVQGVHPGAITIPEIRDRVSSDQRISLVDGDLPTRAHAALFAAADVCLAPSRWEGLGLHLYEAAALGLPSITTAAPPMDEVVIDGVDGTLVACTPAETMPSGVQAVEPDGKALRKAIRRLADDGARAKQAEGARAAAVGRLSWTHTTQAFRDLLT